MIIGRERICDLFKTFRTRASSRWVMSWLDFKSPGTNFVINKFAVFTKLFEVGFYEF